MGATCHLKIPRMKVYVTNLWKKNWTRKKILPHSYVKHIRNDDYDYSFVNNVDAFKAYFFKINWKESYKVIIWKNVVSSNFFEELSSFEELFSWTCQMNFFGGYNRKRLQFFSWKVFKIFQFKTQNCRKQ